MNLLAELPAGSRIVAVRLRSLGDAVLTTPALALIKRTRPDLKISVALDRPLAPLLEGAPDVDEVVGVDRGDLVGAVRAIRARRPALCWNLHGGSTSAWMSWASGARRRAGYAHFSRRFVYNVRIPRAQQILGRDPNQRVHTAEHHAAGAFYLGARREPIPAARLPAVSPLRQGRYAVLHVAAAYDTKRWPEENFLKIAQSLRDRYGLEPVILAGPGEDDLLQRFEPFETRPALDVRALMGLLAGASLFVGNDSGPAHVAAAYSVPCVVVFGSSDSAVWGPWRTRGEVVETSWSCKPCPGDRCYEYDEPRCILSVTTEMVERAIERLLAG